MGEVSRTGSSQPTGSTPGDLGGTENVQGGRTASEIHDESDAVVQEMRSQIDKKMREIEQEEAKVRYYRSLPNRGHAVGFFQGKADRLKDEVEELRGRIGRVQQEANQQIQDLNSLDNMLAKGDIEGAFMLVQTNRTLSLDRQIAERLKALQARNDEIKDLNDRLAAINKPDKDLTPEERERKVQLRGQIDKLNADSQLDTIKLQSVINKRNQALEMLTNLLQKFQKVLDSIVGNMR